MSNCQFTNSFRFRLFFTEIESFSCSGWSRNSRESGVDSRNRFSFRDALPMRQTRERDDLLFRSQISDRFGRFFGRFLDAVQGSFRHPTDQNASAESPILIFFCRTSWGVRFGSTEHSAVLSLEVFDILKNIINQTVIIVTYRWSVKCNAVIVNTPNLNYMIILTINYIITN